MNKTWLRLFGHWLALFTDLTLPAAPPIAPAPEPEPESDGRKFGWQRLRGTRRPVMPVIVFEQRIGGQKEFVGDLHLMKPHEYQDDLDTLAKRYPCPPLAMD